MTAPYSTVYQVLRFSATCAVSLLFSFPFFASCHSGSIGSDLSPDKIGLRVRGLGAYGIFDPSFASRPNDGVWMSVSSVDPSYRWPSAHPHTVSTALARSMDRGRSWKYIALLNIARDIQFEKRFANVGKRVPFTWNHEVSNLVYDPYAKPPVRWKLFWHRYALIKGRRRFEYGWIAYKEASAPEKLAAAPEIKLFTGKLYSAAANIVGGPPRSRLHTLHPALSHCLAFTEPSALARNGRLYLSMFCPSHEGGRIVLLALREGRWHYTGSFLENKREAKALSKQYPEFRGFSAPELAEKKGRLYLIVTPSMPRKYPSYRGCMVMEVSDLGRARLRRRGAAPEIVHYINGGDVGGGKNQHRGACAYHQTLEGGIFLSRAYPRAVKVFRVFRTGVEL